MMSNTLARMLERLTEKVERANGLQHSGGAIEPEDWAELYQLCGEARAVLKAGEASERATLHYCTECGSSSVASDAFVSMNDPGDVSTYDYTHCHHCEGECRTDEAPRSAFTECSDCGELWLHEKMRENDSTGAVLCPACA